MPEPLRPCLCCGEILGSRQIYRHLAKYQQQLESEIGTLSTNMNMDLGNAHAHEEPGQSAADVDAHMGDFDPDIPPVPPNPTHGLRRNPPVTIEDWPDPDLNLDASDDELDNNSGEPVDGPNCDPEYSEHVQPPTFDPVDEPELTDEEIRRLLRVQLGDLAEEEWPDLSQVGFIEYAYM
ncbi:Transposase family Tnp2 protein [Ceratobasidium theobromae]|uniref:Transposase family Tnp2 protein n=1 Tax=Ceratobasidium theobromae TaxID=1582974 RepID=A0A5N5Q8Q4_9AGAM|nr:Transposase family Tnp2 protein [Ceratobasidium theobromae]